MASIQRGFTPANADLNSLDSDQSFFDNASLPLVQSSPPPFSAGLFLSLLPPLLPLLPLLLPIALLLQHSSSAAQSSAQAPRVAYRNIHEQR